MVDVAKLQIRIDSIEAELAEKRLKDLERQGGKTAKSTSILKREFSNAKLAAAGFVAAMATKKIVAAADAYSRLSAQLKLVTGSTEKAEQVYGDLFKVAQATRSEIGPTVDLYARLARSTDELGLSQSELLTVTTAINQSFQVSGATSQEAANAIVQLSQGLAAGALRGDEFNSVMEQSPRLAKAIADEMKVSIGDLRAMAAEGKLTAETVSTALINQSQAIQGEFNQMPLTVGQSLTQMQNDIFNAFSKTDISPILDSVKEMRDIFSDPAFIQNAVTLGNALIKVFTEVSNVLVGTAGMVDHLYKKLSGDDANDPGRLSREIMKLQEDLQNLDNEINEGITSKHGIFGNTDADIKALKGERLEIQLQIRAYEEWLAKSQKARDGDLTPKGSVVPELLTPKTLSSDKSDKELEAENKAAIKKTEIWMQEQQRMTDLDRMNEQRRVDNLASVAQSLLDEETLLEVAYERRRMMIEENTAVDSELRMTLLAENEAQLSEARKTLEAKEQADRLQNYGQMFDGMAGLAKTFAGEQSGIYKTMFAASKAFAIAESVIKIQQGIASAAALPFPANIPAMGVVAAQTAGIISQIQGANYSGAYEKGGDIPSGSIGLVGEAGPELIKGPATVTSAKQTKDAFAGGGGGGIQINNLIDMDSLRSAVIGSQEFEETVQNIINVKGA